MTRVEAETVATPAHRVLKPLLSRSAGEQVADRLVTALALGQFAVGESLPSERDLASMLGVSRTTVRQGIASLLASGYVSVRRGNGGGIFVMSVWRTDTPDMIRRTLLPDWTRLEHLFDYRAIVEAEIARVAARRRTQSNVDALRRALEQYVASPAHRASSQFADLELHRAIVAATGNPYLVELSRTINRDVSLGMGVDPWSPALRERGLQQHPGLVDAVIEGDDERAGTLALEHFSLTEQTIRDLFDNVNDSPEERQESPPDEGDHAHP